MGAANAGVAGYAFQKLSADSGSAVLPVARGIKDRSFGIGPDIKFIDPSIHLGVEFRYLQQFGVQASTSGKIFVVGITFLGLLHPPPSRGNPEVNTSQTRE